MLKKVFDTGVWYFLIAILFAIGAVAKTISADSTVIAMQWFCAIGFGLIGVMKLRKSTS